MNHIFVGLTLSLFCVLLAYYFFPVLLLVAVFLVVLAGLYFKDDFTLFSYVATHVASFYLWIYEAYCSLLNMYHQSNNTNFPVRKCIENNGTVSTRFDSLHHRLRTNVPNLNSPYTFEVQPRSSPTWNSNNSSSTHDYFSSRSSSPLSTVQEMSRLKIHANNKQGNESFSQSVFSGPSVSAKIGSRHPERVVSKSKEIPAGPTPNKPSSAVNYSSIDYNQSLDAKLYANVNSPGFCSRIAEGLPEAMTHQPKYDTVGAFPMVNLRSQYPKIKIKTPVRVRLAPTSNDLIYTSIANSTMSRSPMMETDESMKSVLQVLKEISRKRMHSHVDEDREDNTKRLRVSDIQYGADGVLHTSLLQQTIQGKRAREDTSPAEDDVKKRRKPLQNNEITSSLSSSISIKAPHLITKKRKAQTSEDTSGSPTGVVGKLLKATAEISPSPSPSVTLPSTSSIQECLVKSPSPAISSSSLSVTSPASVSVEKILEAVDEPARISETAKDYTERDNEKVIAEQEEDGAVSRLLGRMSSQVNQTDQVDIPVKRNVFMKTNDLSLSPPKENRLAAMIAVLGGPSENLDVLNSQPDNPKQPEESMIKGKALFTSPATPDTPKQTKKVTFSDSLTTTKIFERDQSENGNTPIPNATPVVSHSTPLSALTFGVNSSPTPPEGNLNLRSSPFLVGDATKSDGHLNNTENTSKSSLSSNILPAVSGQTSPFFQQSSNSSTQNVPALGGSGSLFTPSPGAASSSSKLATPEQKPPGGFGFGLSRSSVEREGAPKQIPAFESSPSKMFSFVGEANKNEAVLSSGFPSLFTSNNSQNDATKTAGTPGQTNAIEENKPSLNIFANKDAKISPISPGNKNEIGNKQLVNGFAPTTTSNATSFFSFNTPATQSDSNKPGFSSFSTSSNPSKTTPAFSFGSPNMFSTASSPSSSNDQKTSVPSLSSQTPKMISSNVMPQPNPASVTSAGQTAQSVIMFSNTTNSVSQTKPSPFSSNIQTTQGLPAFGNGSLKITDAFKAESGKTQTNLFGGVSDNTTSKPTMFGIASTANPMFGLPSKPVSSEANKNGPFGISLNTTAPQVNTMFGSNSSITSQSTFGNPPTSAQSTFGNPSTTTPSTFGNTSTTSESNFGNTSTTGQTTFGNPSTTPQPTFGITSTTAQSAFGNTPTTAQTMFGNKSTTAQSLTLFGNISSSSGPQASSPFAISLATSVPSSVFSSPSCNQKPMFQNTSTTNPVFGASTNTPPVVAFGNQNITSPTFGNQTNTVSSAFGTQTNTAAPGFATQTNTAFVAPNNSFGNSNNPINSDFGNQNGNTQNTSQTGFSTSTTFNLGSSSNNVSEVKPPAFSSSSPFMFGNSAPNKEPAKPFASAAPFSFGSNIQPSTTSLGTSPAQPSMPTFGAANQGFGMSQQQQTPTFGGGVPQPSAPAFNFGQASSAPGTTFQFNAGAPQTLQGGGMFSIGSGSSAPRSKTGAFRRRHKPT